MHPDILRLRKAPGPAEKALAVLGAQVSEVYGRLRHFRERYDAQLTPAERLWLRLTCAEVQGYRAVLAHSGRPRPGDDSLSDRT